MSAEVTYVIEATKDGKAVGWRQTVSVGLAWGYIEQFLAEGLVVRVERHERGLGG